MPYKGRVTHHAVCRARAMLRRNSELLALAEVVAEMHAEDELRVNAHRSRSASPTMAEVERAWQIDQDNAVSMPDIKSVQDAASRVEQHALRIRRAKLFKK